ncbi:hypothetical protein ACVU7I_18480, partial [Patulibacter sp. S7RM1-6]
MASNSSRRSRRPAVALVAGAGALVALVAGAAPATSTAAVPCRSALSAALGTHDPTTLEDEALATVGRRGGRAVSGVRVTVSRAGRTYATGRATGTLKARR